MGVELAPHRNLAAIDEGSVDLSCVFTGRRETRRCGCVVMVTARLPNDDLYHELMADRSALDRAGIVSVTRVGDCLAPGTIAAAVYGGHCYAREFDEPTPEGVPFRRELPLLADA
jgi:dimethylamine/trimethylamine dehydrogenase